MRPIWILLLTLLAASAAACARFDTGRDFTGSMEKPLPAPTSGRATAPEVL